MNLRDSESIRDDDAVSRTLARGSAAVPESKAPDTDFLSEAVFRRRKVRRRARGAGLVAGLGVIAFGMVMLRSDPAIPTHESRPSSPQTLGTKLAEDVTQTDGDTPLLRVLARISQPQPIFQIDPETQQAWQIGWVETERSIPIDMNQFSQSQRQLFQTLLFKEDTLPTL